MSLVRDLGGEGGCREGEGSASCGDDVEGFEGKLLSVY